MEQEFLVKVYKSEEERGSVDFRVVIEENSKKTIHIVSLNDTYYQTLVSGTVKREELIKESFNFLLMREPKESIMPEFNLKEIETYFPGYETYIKKHFA